MSPREGSSWIHLRSFPFPVLLLALWIIHQLNINCTTFLPFLTVYNYSWYVLFMPISLARATLVLIPLLGIHEVVFTVLIDECVEGNSRYARNFINLTLSSFQVTPIELITSMISVFVLNPPITIICLFFQGFLVAVLYCFANGEVHLIWNIT